MSRNHLKRRGFKANPEKIAAKDLNRIAGAIVGRRARKEWPCAAEDCINGLGRGTIEWDDVYVEMTEPTTFRGPDSVPPAKRYHMHCALRHELIVKDEGEVINRRAAVAMTKAKRG